MLFSASFALTVVSSLTRLVSSALIPGADSPVFYLLGDDAFGDTFKPLRLTGQHGVATLTGEAPLALLYFINGSLVAQDPSGGSTSSHLYHPYLDFSTPSPSFLSTLYPANKTEPYPGECGPSGRLMFVQDIDGVHGSGRKKVEKENGCAQFETFSLFSDRMDARLGAKLIFNTNLTEFYACGSLRDIVHKSDASDMPIDCDTVVHLFTLPTV